MGKWKWKSKKAREAQREERERERQGRRGGGREGEICRLTKRKLCGSWTVYFGDSKRRSCGVITLHNLAYTAQKRR